MKFSNKFYLVSLFSVIAVILFLGCVAAIPIVVYYYNTNDNYVATAEVRRNADDLWLAVVRLAEKRASETEGKIDILKKDNTQRLLEATDGKQTASVKVIPDGRRKSKVVITANVPKGMENELAKEKELAAQIMRHLCEEAKAECKLAES
ncbi:hypothetical protein D1AOALGA4SA_1332 [Olavius algarvensis Delta 1 endosymbiont]|nr:hypothetical protein D1AOALGA4SA_1332 [Olavius algarvensis Delta 1 endosymbiont]